MSAKSSPQIRMAMECLVDSFEQMLGVAQHLSCELKPGVYAACIAEQREVEVPKMVPTVMCSTCRALWHLQVGKDLWVKLGKKWNRRWDPMKMMPEEDRADPADVPGLSSTVVAPSDAA